MGALHIEKSIFDIPPLAQQLDIERAPSNSENIYNISRPMLRVDIITGVLYCLSTPSPSLQLGISPSV